MTLVRRTSLPLLAALVLLSFPPSTTADVLGKQLWVDTSDPIDCSTTITWEWRGRAEFLQVSKSPDYPCMWNRILQQIHFELCSPTPSYALYCDGGVDDNSQGSPRLFLQYDGTWIVEEQFCWPLCDPYVVVASGHVTQVF